MTEPEYDRAVGMVATILCNETDEPTWSAVVIAKNIVTALSDDLRKASEVEAIRRGTLRWEQGYQRGKVQGARQVVESVLNVAREGWSPRSAARMLNAARTELAEIKRGDE